MKNAVLLLAISFFASVVFATESSSDKANLYAQAILLDLQKVGPSIKCTRTDTGEQPKVLELGTKEQFQLMTISAEAATVTVTENGEQPLITIVNNFGEMQRIQSAVTTADLNNVITLTVTDSRLANVNTGNLQNPKIEKQFTVEKNFVCKIR